jgi:NitT/TauT family transport system substrate-binding protein
MSAGLRALAALLALATALPASAADQVTLATSRLIAYVAVPIMLDRGFLAEEGIDAKLVTFDSAQPITVAVVSGDADFGVGGLSAAFYTLAGQGQLRVIAAGTREMPGFNGFAVLASRKSEEAGLKGLKDLGGHSVGVTQVGTMLEYSVGLVAAKYGIDFGTLRIMPLQSNGNLVAALIGNQVDAGLMPGAPAAAAVARGEIRQLAWLSAEVPGGQNNVAFASTRIANDRPNLVRRFLAAYRKAAQLYHDAVADAQEHRRDGPALQSLLPVLAKFANLSPEAARASLGWIDRSARLDKADMRRQIDWYTAHALMKESVDIDKIVDKRYATELPGS